MCAGLGHSVLGVACTTTEEKSSLIVQAQHDLALPTLPPCPLTSCHPGLLTNPHICPFHSHFGAFALAGPLACKSLSPALPKPGFFCRSELSLNVTSFQKPSPTSSSKVAAPPSMFHHTITSSHFHCLQSTYYQSDIFPDHIFA